MDKKCRAGERYLAFLDVTMSVMDGGRTVSTNRLYRILQVGPVVEAQQLIQAESTNQPLVPGLNVCTYPNMVLD